MRAKKRPIAFLLILFSLLFVFSSCEKGKNSSQVSREFEAGSLGIIETVKDVRYSVFFTNRQKIHSTNSLVQDEYYETVTIKVFPAITEENLLFDRCGVRFSFKHSVWKTSLKSNDCVIYLDSKGYGEISFDISCSSRSSPYSPQKSDIRITSSFGTVSYGKTDFSVETESNIGVLKGVFFTEDTIGTAIGKLSAPLIAWVIWFLIAKKKNNINQMKSATVTCFSLFVATLFGVLWGLLIFVGFIIYKKLIIKEIESESKEDDTNEYDTDSQSHQNEISEDDKAFIDSMNNFFKKR